MARTKLTKKNMKKVAKANAKKRDATKIDPALAAQPVPTFDEVVTAMEVEDEGAEPTGLRDEDADEGATAQLVPHPGAQTPDVIKAEAEAHDVEEHRNDPRLSPLARAYVVEGIESLAREPSPNLYRRNPDYYVTIKQRAQALKAYIRKEGELVGFVNVLEDHAMEGDTILLSNMLRDVMRQAVWMGSIDQARFNRVSREYTQEQFDEDQQVGVDAALIGRDSTAPVGLEDAADNTDAIMGMAGDSERPAPPDPEMIETALTDVNVWLNILASEYKVFAIPFGSAPEGYDVRGRQRFRNIEGPREALEVQAKLNAQAMRKKAIAQAERDATERKRRLAAVVNMAK